ncbi:MAG: hypothetical protein HRU25_14855 [Psychrobium sp.]|nr:hypothetical protein [Psychrobium sp.]
MDAGIDSLLLATQSSFTQQNGNTIGITSAYTDINGNEYALADVWFSYDVNNSSKHDVLSPEMVDGAIELVYLRSLTVSLIKTTVTQSSSQYARIISEFRTLYTSEVVDTANYP